MYQRISVDDLGVAGSKGEAEKNCLKGFVAPLMGGELKWLITVVRIGFI
jgi:hypothetical protein